MYSFSFRCNRWPVSGVRISPLFAFLLALLPAVKSWAASPTVNAPGFASQGDRPDPNRYLLRRQGSEPNQVREIIPAFHSNPSKEVPRVWRPPPILGCWSQTIHRADLTSVVQTGSKELGEFFDETYRICFAAYPDGPLVPTVTSAEETLDYQSVKTSVTGWSNHQATLKNVVVYQDPTAKAHPVLASIARLFTRPCTLVQNTDLNCRLEGESLRVEADASASCNGAPIYKMRWKAAFARTER